MVSFRKLKLGLRSRDAASTNPQSAVVSQSSLSAHVASSAATSTNNVSTLASSINDLTVETRSLPEQLWDQAYDRVKAKEPKLVEAYEQILSKELGYDVGSQSGTPNQEQLQRLLTVMASKTEKSSRIKDKSAPYMTAVRSVKDTVGSAISASKEAALAWSAVCIVLEFLVNATKESASNRDGLEYVIERLEFNNRLAYLRLNDDHQTVREQEVGSQIRERIIGLYKNILIYLMKSVCYYNRNGLAVVLRDSIKLDGWEDLLKDVKDAEAAVERDETSLKAYQNTTSLKELLGLARKAEVRALTAEDDECLRKLRITDPRDDKKRIEMAKGGLLQDSYRWILENQEYKTWRSKHSSLWIHGDPGKGKTMLLCGIIDEWLADAKNHGPLPPMSYFFCQASDPRLNTAENVLRGLLYMLVEDNHEFIIHIRKRFDKSGSGIFDDANIWIVLTDIFNDIIEAHPGICFVVDALDECDHGRDLLLDLIRASAQKVCWVVSSRNWPEIEEALTSASMNGVSLELNAKSVSTAVEVYINIKVTELEKAKRLSHDTIDIVKDYLHKNAEGTFLWVSLVCHNLQRASKFQILAMLRSFPPGLDAVYLRMLEQLNNEESGHTKSVLSMVAYAYRPLTLLELSALFPAPEDISEKELWLIDVTKQSGYLAIQESSNETTIVFVHLSAKEFVLHKAGASLDLQPSDVHHLLFSRSIDLMDEHLRCNVYDIKESSMRIDAVSIPDPDPLIYVSYSCSYWIDHFLAYCRSQQDLEGTWWSEYASFHHFLRLRFLYWIESLSLLQDLTHGVQSMLYLKNVLTECERDSKIRNSDVDKLLSDASRFILSCNGLVAEYPLQLYASALLFAPATSSVRQDFAHEIPSWVSVQSKLKPCPDNVATYSVPWTTSDPKSRALTCSPDGRLVAVACGSKINVRSGTTGAAIISIDVGRPLQGGVSFSHDGAKIAETSQADCVRCWSSSDGRLVEGHQLMKLVSVLANELNEEAAIPFSPKQRFGYSPRGSWMAYASSRNIRIWNPSWKLMRTLKTPNEVKSFVVAADEKLMAICCRTNTIHVKDVATGSELWKTTLPEDQNIHTLVLSPSPEALVISSDEQICTYNTMTGAQLDSMDVEHCCDFAMNDGAYAWLDYRDTISDHRGRHRGRFAGGVWDLTSRLAFTSLWLITVSSHKKGTVRLWDWDNFGVRMDAPGHSTLDHEDDPQRIVDLVVSWNRQYVACLMSKSLAIWDKNLEFKKIGFETYRTGSDAWLRFINENLLLSYGLGELNKSDKIGLQIWDVHRCKLLLTIQCNDNINTDLVASINGRVAWIADTEPDHEEIIYSFIVTSQDSTSDLLKYDLTSVAQGPSGTYSCLGLSSTWWIAAGRMDGTIDLWDENLKKQESIVLDEKETKQVYSVSYSADGTNLAVEYDDNLVVWNMTTRTIVTNMRKDQEWDSAAIEKIFNDDALKCFRDDKQFAQLRPDNGEIFLNGDWILLGSNQILKLPVEFQTSKAIIWDNDVFFAHEGGGSTIIRIDREKWQETR